MAQSRRLLVNIGDVICCKKWKNKVTEHQPHSSISPSMDSSVLDIVADITSAETKPVQNLVEQDWMKRFYQVEVNESVCDGIFQSDEEEDEDFNDRVKEPCPLRFDDVEVKGLYQTRPEKSHDNNGNQEAGNPKFWKYLVQRPPMIGISS